MKTQIATFVALPLLATTFPAHAQVGDPQPHDTRIESLLDTAGIVYQIDSDGDFRLVHQAEGDRTHLVWINSHTQKYGKLEIREIWSVGYLSDDKLPADLSRSLLEKNSQYKLGSWKVEKINGKEAAIFYTQVAASLDQQSLLTSMKIVAESGDELEEELTSKDDL